MNKYFLFLTFLFFTIAAQAVTQKSTPNGKIAFTENKGQVSDQFYKPRPDVLFAAKSGNLTLHIRKTGVSYQLSKVEKSFSKENLLKFNLKNQVSAVNVYRVDIEWLKANANFAMVSKNPFSGMANYYLPHCPQGINGVKSFEDVMLSQLYTGIDLHYYSKEGNLKYDFIVSANANYKQIQMKVQGGRPRILKNGALIISTPAGEILEEAPLVYQDEIRIPAKWVISGDVISYEIGKYDKNKELVIDPLTRQWGTYFGGLAAEEGYSCSVDANGNSYLTGVVSATSGTAIITSGAHQQTFGGGTWDAFLVKFNSAGVRQWSTYYGGPNDEYGRSCSPDNSGNIYMAGYGSLSSGTIMATTGCHQSNFGGGVNDAFLVKFNSSGARIWATYYGGSGEDRGYSCTTDGIGNIYMSGYSGTTTGTAIATLGGHQATYIGGTYDAFLVKFDGNGVRQWGTYYGLNGDDYGYSCATDPSNNVYLAGNTAGSGTLVASSNGHQLTNGGGSTDAFLVKFNSMGVRQWGTFYGGGVDEYCYSCCVDGGGNVFLAGQTTSNSGTNIATSGSHQQTYGGLLDGFIAKFNSNGIRQWGTYLGGNNIDNLNSSATDAAGNIYVSGDFGSAIGITTPGSYQPTSNGNDVWLVKFNSSGSRVWGTFYGGSGNDLGGFCAASSAGVVYLAGKTSTSTGTVVASPGSHQSIFGGGSTDSFLIKFNDCINLNPISAVNPTVCLYDTLNFSVTITGSTIPVYQWVGPNSFTSSLQNPTIVATSTLFAGIYTVSINNNGCIETSTTQVQTVNTLPTISVSSGTICSGNSFTISPAGANSYTYQGGINVVSPQATSIYTLIGSNSVGCISSSPITCTVTVNISPTISVNSGTICQGKTFTIIPTGASSYSVQGLNFIVQPTVSSTYTIVGTSSLGCLSTNIATCSIVVLTSPIISLNGGTICSGQSFTFNPTGATSYTIQGGTFVITPSSSGNYTVIGTGSNGCTSIANAFVGVNPLPTVTVPNGSVCLGNSYTLSPAGASSYIVQGGNLIVSPSVTSTYTMVGVSALGCLSSNIVTSTVSVLPAPAVGLSANLSIICAGQFAILTASGAINYTYSTGAIGNTLIVQPFTSTQYLVTGTAANGCESTAAITVIVDNCMGLSRNNRDSQIQLYPNPSKEFVILVISESSNVTIVNSIGQLLYSHLLDKGENRLDLRNYPPGFYTLIVWRQEEPVVFKLVVE